MESSRGGSAPHHGQCRLSSRRIGRKCSNQTSQIFLVNHPHKLPSLHKMEKGFLINKLWEKYITSTCPHLPEKSILDRDTSPLINVNPVLNPFILFLSPIFSPYMDVPPFGSLLFFSSLITLYLLTLHHWQRHFGSPFKLMMSQGIRWYHKIFKFTYSTSISCFSLNGTISLKTTKFSILTRLAFSFQKSFY